MQGNPVTLGANRMEELHFAMVATISGFNGPAERNKGLVSQSIHRE